jgi:hypothetical protein
MDTDIRNSDVQQWVFYYGRYKTIVQDDQAQNTKNESEG